jgi:siroheme synthase
VLSKLSLPGARHRTGTLGTIAAVADGLASPAVVVIGEVVAVADRCQTPLKVSDTFS